MTGFSIDEVAASFAADLATLIGRVNGAAAAVNEQPIVKARGDDGAPFFGAVSDAGHSIKGTSRLIGAESVALGGEVLEELAREGAVALETAARSVRRAREIAAACLAGGRAIESMVDLELRHDADTALAIARDFQARGRLTLQEAGGGTEPVTVEAAMRRAGAGPDEEVSSPSGDGDSFSFDGVERLATEDVDEDLVAVFRAEATEMAAGIHGDLKKLHDALDDKALAANLDRMYHTLRGAAAAVGLSSIASVFKRLQEAMSQAAEGQQKLNPASWSSLVSSTKQCYAAAGVELGSFDGLEVDDDDAPPLESGFTFAVDDSQVIDNELLEVFRSEVRQLAVTIRAHLHGLKEKPSEMNVWAQLERLYHTLKGAAATIGRSAIADAAAALRTHTEALLDADTQPTADQVKSIAEETDKLFAMAGLGPVGLAAPGDLAIEHAFLQEATEIVQRASELVPGLSSQQPSVAASAASALGQLFHRLAGSASMNNRADIAEEAGRIKQLCARERDPAAVAASLKVIAGALGVSLPSQPVVGSAPLPGDGAGVLGALAAAATLVGGAGGAPYQAIGTSPGGPVHEAVQLVAEGALYDAFRMECADLLESLDGAILRLHDSANPRGELDETARLIHTLKGTVNTVGLTPTGRLLHRVEDFFELLLSRPILPAMRSVASLLVSMQDEVRRHLRDAPTGMITSNIARLEQDIKMLLGSGQMTIGARTTGAAGPPQPLAAPRAKRAGDSENSSVRSSTRGSAAPEQTEKRTLRIASERIDALMNLAGELVLSRSRLSTRVGAIKGLERDLRGSRGRLLGTVDGFRERYEFNMLATTRKQVMRVDQSSADSRPTAVIDMTDATSTAEGTNGRAGEFSDLELDHYEDVNILARTLSEITNDITEVHGQLFKEIGGFAEDIDAFSFLVSSLQRQVTTARMVSLDSLFTRLRLLVLDSAEREEKQVSTQLRGEQVAVDKTILDQIYTPLLHLVRNAVTHGIESPQRRAELNKPPIGTVSIGARQEAGRIIIEVVDDGAGLDLDALKQRGVALGLIPEDTRVEDPRVADLVFAKGVSTRAKATATAGRGIGGEAVRNTVNRMNGQVHVQTERGVGTRFTIMLPLTLAITRALIVRVEDHRYAIPLYFTERIVEAADSKIVESAGVKRLVLEGRSIMLIDANEVFHTGHSAAASGPIVVLHLHVGDGRLAIRVDAVLNQEEIFVRSLGGLLSGHPLFAGVMVSGSGEPHLILDTHGIMAAVGISRAELYGAAAPMLERLLPERTAPAAHLPRKDQPLRVLFIDDSLSVRKVAEKLLASLGVQVTLAVDGVDGLEKLRAGTFDLVFTDLEMPRLHGYDLIRELRTLPAYRDLPIIVVTSRSGQKHRDHARAVGANEYVTKPFTAERFAEILAKTRRPAGGAGQHAKNPEYPG